MRAKSNSKYITHIPSEGAVDDRNTIEGQLVGVDSSWHLSTFIAAQIKKYLSLIPHPATRENLFLYAERHNAEDNTLNSIRSLSQEFFDAYNAKH